MTTDPTYAGAPPERRPGAGMAITALVLGILALLLFWSVVGGIILGLAAIVLGLIASGRAKRGRASGRGMAITGVVLGLIGLVLSVVLIAVGATLWSKLGFGDLQDCLKRAGDNTSQQQDCQREFQRDVENKN